jgi:hypothetical protein
VDSHLTSEMEVPALTAETAAGRNRISGDGILTQKCVNIGPYFRSAPTPRKRYFYPMLIIIMDMSSTCSSCGKKTQDYPIFCYMCDDYFCSENCHMEKHSRPWQKF